MNVYERNLYLIANFMYLHYCGKRPETLDVEKGLTNIRQDIENAISYSVFNLNTFFSIGMNFFI